MKIRTFSVFALMAIALSAPAMAGTFGSQFNNGLGAIIGGTDVSSSDPVALSTVLVVAKENGSVSLCSGTIIDTDIILTAAHCVGVMSGQAQMVVVFRTSIQGTGPVIAVADRTRPDDFLSRARNGASDWHDLALLKLARPIPAGYTIAKFLPSASMIRNGGSVTLAGYGINVPVTPEKPVDNSGAGTLRKVDQVILEDQLGETEFLVSLADGKGACHGDSGGPAYIRQGGQLYIAGVASRMTERDRIANNGDVRDFSCSVDMVYTSVLGDMDWIQGGINKLHSGQ